MSEAETTRRSGTADVDYDDYDKHYDDDDDDDNSLVRSNCALVVGWSTSEHTEHTLCFPLSEQMVKSLRFHLIPFNSILCMTRKRERIKSNPMRVSGCKRAR